MNDRHIATVLALHFDPDQGSPYWLQRQQQLGFDVRREIRGHADFHRLGPMDVSALRTRPLTDFIPRALHRELATMLLSETGGTTGDPCRRVFSPREFDSAFIAPWLKAVAEHGFPRQGCWLFVGPGGPHIIDRSARFMARSLGSLEPFTVDCDVRWIKRQARGSIGFTLYMEHVIAQAMNIINQQRSTPCSPPRRCCRPWRSGCSRHSGSGFAASTPAACAWTRPPRANCAPGFPGR